MFNKLVFIGLLGFSALGVANTNDDIKAYQDQALQEVQKTSAIQIEGFKASSVQNQSQNKTLIDSIMQSAVGGLPDKQKPKGADGAILFVSFSMPTSLLFALSDEAAAFNIPVVIKGLVEGDFKKTILTFKQLQTDAKKQGLNFNGVSIDPVWFGQFHITSVPALVVTELPEQCRLELKECPQPFDVVYGNSRIKQSLELIAQKGEAAPKRALSILEGAHV